MHMSNIIAILDQRAAITSGGLEQKLCSIAHDIIKLSCEHQKKGIKNYCCPLKLRPSRMRICK